MIWRSKRPDSPAAALSDEIDHANELSSKQAKTPGASDKLGMVRNLPSKLDPSRVKSDESQNTPQELLGEVERNALNMGAEAKMKSFNNLTTRESLAPRQPIQKKHGAGAAHVSFHDTATYQTKSCSYEKPAACQSWVNSGDLWPGRSEIQEVANGVCITNFFGAKNLPLLVANGITHVLICANELPEAFPHSFQYFKLKAFTDNTGTDLLKQLDIALPWIDVVSQDGGRVLLHCATGSSRSGSILVAYLMHSLKCSLRDGLEVCRQVRPIVKPNPGFLEQLEKWSPYRCGRTSSTTNT